MIFNAIMTSKEIRPGTEKETEKICWRLNVWNQGKHGKENKVNSENELVKEIIESGKVALIIFEGGRYSRVEASRYSGTFRAYMRKNYPEIPIETKVQKDVVDYGTVLAVRIRTRNSNI